MNLFDLMFWAVAGWVVVEIARRAALQVLHNRSGEYERMAARRRWLQALPDKEWRASGPRPQTVHPPCGTDHLPWEACPAAPPRIIGVTRIN